MRIENGNIKLVVVDEPSAAMDERAARTKRDPATYVSKPTRARSCSDVGLILLQSAKK